ncbi:MAG: biotin--[acetyl-CoA-carboxylase] ligase [Planctomycetes bacterium]|nr:biotin--[acetyl-CoA-carboxylase] ligase [Planctomycetota bacterium]
MNPREEWNLGTRRLGRRVWLFDRLDSTNRLAAALADDPANDGLVILAGEQTAGRGQHGRTWQCSPGTGVLLSVLLFPSISLRRPALLTAWAAVSVCETIRALSGLEPRIKWPNDVLIQGKKVCGILMDQWRRTVAGIGLNVNQTADDLARAELPDAGSLAVFTGQRLDVSTVARRLIEQLDEEYDRLCWGNLAALETSWKAGLGLLGQEVVAECWKGQYQGRLSDLSWDEVVLEGADGRRWRFAPEGVKHLEPAPGDSESREDFP